MWERGDDRTIGDHQGQHGDRRGVGLVHVQDVELPVDDPLSQPRYAWGEKVTRDTDPLYGIASAGPAETT